MPPSTRPGGARSPSNTPARGEIWDVDFNPTRGREQSGTRPALILSADPFNRGPADLVIVIPLTSKQKSIPSHVLVPAGEAGLTANSYIKCEDIRSISKERLLRYRGDVTYPRLEETTRIMRRLLDF
jgi:mRNA interferase MazF